MAAAGAGGTHALCAQHRYSSQMMAAQMVREGFANVANGGGFVDRPLV